VFHGRVTETLTSRMKEKIDTPEGRAIYSRRLGTVEPVFANIGAQKGMSRSTLRGVLKHPVAALLPGPQPRKGRPIRDHEQLIGPPDRNPRRVCGRSPPIPSFSETPA
jgi:hypothetical protein